MSDPTDTDRARDVEQFEEQASQRQGSLARELLDFIVHNKKWWLTPILLVLLILGVLVMLGGTGVAPFIYTLF